MFQCECTIAQYNIELSFYARPRDSPKSLKTIDDRASARMFTMTPGFNGSTSVLVRIRAHCAMVRKTVRQTTLRNCAFVRNREQLSIGFQRFGADISAHARRSGMPIDYEFSKLALLCVMTRKLFHLRFCKNVCEDNNLTLVCTNARARTDDLISELSTNIFCLLNTYSQLRICFSATFPNFLKV